MGPYLSNRCLLAKNSLIIFYKLDHLNVLGILLEVSQQNLANNLWFIANSLDNNTTVEGIFDTHRRKLGLQSLIFHLDTETDILDQIQIF
jgi:hypothetical protein